MDVDNKNGGKPMFEVKFNQFSHLESDYPGIKGEVTRITLIALITLVALITPDNPHCCPGVRAHARVEGGVL